MDAAVWETRWALPTLRLDRLALRPDVVERVLTVKVPVPALDALPYILTVVVLAGFIGKAVPPRAGGEPYVKER